MLVFLGVEFRGGDEFIVLDYWGWFIFKCREYFMVSKSYILIGRGYFFCFRKVIGCEYFESGFNINWGKLLFLFVGDVYGFCFFCIIKLLKWINYYINCYYLV